MLKMHNVSFFTCVTDENQGKWFYFLVAICSLLLPCYALETPATLHNMCILCWGPEGRKTLFQAFCCATSAMYTYIIHCFKGKCSRLFKQFQQASSMKVLNAKFVPNVLQRNHF